MFASEMYVALIIGTVLSLIFMEIFGVAPGGLIVPGYLALVMNRPKLVIVILIISFLTYLIVMKGISRIVILYGRRKFAAMLVTAIVIKLVMDFVFLHGTPMLTQYEVFVLSGVGIIVPGLIANNIHKQGWMYTMSSTLVMSGLTYGLLNVYHYM